MIINKIYNKLNEEQKGDLVYCLVVGFVSGLVSGLVLGLGWGLVEGLLVGLVSSLVVGLGWGLLVGLVVDLVGGLVIGLVYGLVFGFVIGLLVILFNFSEALPFLSNFPNLLYLIIGIIFLVEILFWLDSAKPKKKDSKFIFTIKRKVEALFEVLFGLTGIACIYILIREGIQHYNLEVQELIIRWVGYLGLGMGCLILIVGVFYVWIKLNKIKYKK